MITAAAALVLPNAVRITANCGNNKFQVITRRIHSAADVFTLNPWVIFGLSKFSSPCFKYAGRLFRRQAHCTSLVYNPTAAYPHQNNAVLFHQSLLKLNCLKYKERTLNYGNDVKKSNVLTGDEKKQKLKNRISTFKEDVVTIPNILCVTRILLSPVIVYCVLEENFGIGFAIFLFAGATDLLDGFIARNFKNQQSMIGSFLDPMADKLLVASLFIALTAVHLIPVPLTALIVCRDLCLLSAGFYIRYQSLPNPKTFKRYFDVTFATAKLSPTTISKFNTGVQLLLVAVTLSAPVFHFVDHPYVHALWYLTATTTILSGVSYMFRKDTYKILTSKERKL